MDNKELMKIFANNINLHSFDFYVESYHKHKFMASIESVEAFEIGQSYVLLDVLTKYNIDEFSYGILIHIFEQDFPVYCKNMLNKLLKNNYNGFIEIKNCKCRLKNTNFSKSRFNFLVGFYG